MVIFANFMERVRSKHWRSAEWLAWGILALWAGVWLLFSVVAGVYTLISDGLLAAVPHGVLFVLIVAVLLTSWNWQVIGGAVAVLVGCMCMLWYGFDAWYLVLLRDLPPLFAGVLLSSWWIKYNEELRLQT